MTKKSLAKLSCRLIDKVINLPGVTMETMWRCLAVEPKRKMSLINSIERGTITNNNQLIEAMTEQEI